ncbi:MAG: portal protein, partial [Chloroflexi bacterium]|nr:portal protein [Chloroflexota bacterium]
MEQLPLPQVIARMDSQRLRGYREHLDFYNGVQWLGTARRRERRLTFNYAKVFVDKVTAYLMSSRTFSVLPAGTSSAARERAGRAEQLLRQVHEDNNLE